MEHSELTGAVIGASYKVYNELGSGFLESVYEKALVIELQELGLKVESQVSLNVKYRDKIVGNFLADIVVDGLVIIELKAVEQLAKVHEVQLVNYLVATGIPFGLLINFGPESVEVRRKTRDFKKISR